MTSNVPLDLRRGRATRAPVQYHDTAFLRGTIAQLQEAIAYQRKRNTLLELRLQRRLEDLNAATNAPTDREARLTAEVASMWDRLSRLSKTNLSQHGMLSEREYEIARLRKQNGQLQDDIAQLRAPVAAGATA